MEVYRLKTLPFGATHSVYNFLRLARMLYTIMVQGLFLTTTNFYDDFVLATPPRLKASVANSMKLVFMLTGLIFARDGKKAIRHSVRYARRLLFNSISADLKISRCLWLTLKLERRKLAR